MSQARPITHAAAFICCSSRYQAANYDLLYPFTAHISHPGLAAVVRLLFPIGACYSHMVSAAALKAAETPMERHER